MSPYTREGGETSLLPNEGPGSTLLGRENQAPFTQPWELRSFAIAVAAHEAGQFEWSEFQGSLIAAIGRWEADRGHTDEPWNYYEHWVTALESVLVRHGALSSEGLQDRTKAVLSMPRQISYHPATREPIAVDPATHSRGDGIDESR